MEVGKRSTRTFLQVKIASHFESQHALRGRTMLAEVVDSELKVKRLLIELIKDGF